MPGPSVVVRVLGDLKGLGTSLDAAGSKASSVAGSASKAFGSFLSGVNQTGALGPLGGMLDGLNNAVGNLAENGKKIGPAMIGAGGAVTALGAGLSAFGSKEQASQQQLSAAIDATGGSYDDYGSAIEAAIKHQENYGHTSDQTQDALRLLTQATHDPQKALDMLGEASDIAAAKHEDLSTAATQLGKVSNGNTKLLKEYGISIDKTTGLTKDGKTAVQALADVTAGQASAAQDTFKGKLDGVKAKIEDSVAQFGMKYGPALQGIGIAVMGLGSIWEVAGPIMAAMSALGLGPILLIAAAIAALIAIAYVLYTNWDTIWAAMKAAISAVWDWIKTYWPLLLGILLGPIGIAVALIVTYWAQIKAGASAVVDWITNVWDSLVGFFAGIPGRVAGYIGALWDGIKNGATDAKNWVSDRLGDVVGFFTGMPVRITNAAAGMFDGIGQAFRGALNWMIDLWNKLHFTMPSFDTHIPGVGTIGGFDVGMPQIPHLAAGGLITADGLVYAHAGEAITPYGGSPAVHVENANFSSDVDIDLFMQRVAWAMQRQTV